MIGKVKEKLSTFLRLYKTIEGSGAFLCMLDNLIKRENKRRITIKGIDTYVRTNTLDIEVAISSLFYEEYGNIRCTDPEIIIDAGANIGTSAIYFATKYPNALIFAVEPEDSNFDMLQMNCKDYNNITIIKAAIWGKIDKRIVKNRYTGHWGYTISDTENKSESTGQEIDCITIGSLMEKYGISNIDLLKMDIEGGEKDVLEKSSDWIDSVDIITVELHDRICMGCDRAFYLSTKDFKSFEKHGEKITAYRS